MAFIFFGLPAEYYIATLIGMGLSLWASARVKSTFHRFSNVGVRSGMTGAQAAAAVARSGGAQVAIERHQGFLSDHYDPRSKTLRLSPEVYDGRSISSIAVAAHEAGHSIQDVKDYAPLRFRSQIVPAANFGNSLWPIAILIGLVANLTGMIYVGIGIFTIGVVFQLVTLPVEFDASKRAKLVLAETGIVSTREEAEGVEKVLDAAAMTYVAAAITSILQLLALIARARDGR